MTSRKKKSSKRRPAKKRVKKAPEKVVLKQEPKESGFKVPFWIYLVIPIFGMLLYANTFSHEYTLDDVPIIQKNQMITETGNIPLLFKSHYWASKDNPTDKGLYRPLTMTSYLLQKVSTGDNATYFHIVNAILHGLVCLMLFLVLQNLFSSFPLSLITSLLFAAHPIHTEAVAGIVGRAELLSLLFMLCSIFFYFRIADQNGVKRLSNGLLAVILFILAAFSKEGGFLTPAVILVTEYLVPDKRMVLTKKWKDWIPFAVILFSAVILWTIRASITEGVAPHEMWLSVSAGTRILTAVRTIGEYFALMLAPFSLSADYWIDEVPYASFSDLKMLLSLLFILGLSVLAIWAIKRKPQISWGLAFLAITLFPVSNLPFAIGVLKAERLLYSPSLGFCLVLATGILILGKQLKKPVIGWAIAGAFLVFFSITTILRNPVWKNNFTLAQATVLTSPNSPRFNNILGQQYMKIKGKKKVAEEYLLKAVESNPNHTPALVNLGLYYRNTKQHKKAIGIFEQVLAKDPYQYEAMVNVMSSYRQLGQYDKALRVSKRALERYPNRAALHWNTSNIYQMKGDQENMQYHRNLAKQLDPNIGN